jgi:hypothetical protein
MTILFTKPDCQKCDWLKEQIDLDALDVKIMELAPMNRESLAELAWHELVGDAEESLPILAVDTVTKVKGAIAIKNYLMRRVSGDVSTNISF